MKDNESRDRQRKEFKERRKGMVHIILGRGLIPIEYDL